MVSILSGRTLDPGDLDEVIKLLEKHRFSVTLYLDLCLHLKLSYQTLQIISQNHTNVHSCFKECLARWLKEANRPTIDMLIAALKRIGNHAVAEGIDEERQDYIGNQDQCDTAEQSQRSISELENTEEIIIGDISEPHINVYTDHRHAEQSTTRIIPLRLIPSTLYTREDSEEIDNSTPPDKNDKCMMFIIGLVIGIIIVILLVGFVSIWIPKIVYRIFIFGSAIVALIAVIAGFIKTWNKDESSITKLQSLLIGLLVPILIPIMTEISKELSK